MRARSGGRLFNHARLKAKMKVREALIRDILFADVAAVGNHTQQELKKTNVLRQDTPSPPAITIDNYKLDVIHQFMYLGSTIIDNLSLELQLLMNRLVRRMKTAKDANCA